MDGGMADAEIVLGIPALSALMPMHLCVTADGMIAGAGPTLGKVFAGRALAGAAFFEMFEVRRPSGVADVGALRVASGQRLHLQLRAAPFTLFRGIAVPLAGTGGVMLNLSFGISVAEAVRDHGLTDADFAPTDLAVELLYLTEAKAAVMGELRAMNRRLEGARSAAEEQALTDTLTGLRNRRALDLALGQAVLQGAPFGLMHIDLDFFKAVNDTLGHAAGDHVLREVAQVLRGQTRGGDTVARVGGDEFVILLPGLVDATRLEVIARRIIGQLDHPILFEDNYCRISASIGLTVSTVYDDLHPDRLLNDADAALYEAKRAGRGRAVFAERVRREGEGE